MINSAVGTYQQLSGLCSIICFLYCDLTCLRVGTSSFYAMYPDKLTLTVADYLILGTTLAVSAGIGLFFQFVTKKKTNEEYLLAGKDMSLIPVIMSLMATFMSATTLMGIPAEMYLYGTNMTFMNVGFLIGPIVAAYVFLPVYFTNDVSTVYEYLEKRFGKTTRKLISVTFTVQSALFTSATLYAPALALSAVTDLSMWLSIIMIGVVCTFYCTLGGMKAVLWADVFQAVLMFICLFAIIIKGSIDLGGVGNIFHVTNEGGRLFFPRFSMNMVAQYTMINVCLQGLIITASSYGGNQIQVQRLRTLKTLSRSKTATFWSIPLIISFHLLCCFCGFIFYAYFRNCDPMTAPNKPIHSADQLMPYFITSAMHDYPGLPGLCIAGIFSASLSTVSSSVNSLAAVTVEDFIQPILPNSEWPQNVLTTKIISLLYGGLCIAFSFLLASLGNLIRMTVIIYGMIAGPNFGVFILAVCTKGANEQGTIIGVTTSLVLAACLSFLPSKSKPPYLPVSNECKNLDLPITNTSMTSNFSSFHYSNILTSETYNATDEISVEEEFSIPVSYMWVSSIALLTCLVVGYFGSIIIACFQENSKEVPDIYLSPVRTWFSKQKANETPNVAEKKTAVTLCNKVPKLKNNQETSRL